MAFSVRRADYYSVTTRAADGYELLETLAALGINLLAFTAVPIGALHTHLTIFPEDPARLAHEAERNRLVLDGPHPAIIAQGDDELGRLARLHEALARENIAVYAASGVADGRGGFGYVLYVSPNECDRAVKILQAAAG